MKEHLQDEHHRDLHIELMHTIDLSLKSCFAEIVDFVG